MIIYLCTLIISYFQNKIHIYIYMIICIFVYLQCLFTYLYVSCIIYKNKNHHYFRIFSLTTLEPPSLHANAGDVGDGISVGTGISCSRRSTVVHGVAPLGPVEAPKCVYISVSKGNRMSQSEKKIECSDKLIGIYMHIFHVKVILENPQ